MVNFVLNDLSRPADKSLDTGLELLVLPLDFNALVAFARARAAEQGKAVFLGVVRSGHLDNFRVKHRHICALVIKDDDPLMHPNHICCNTHAGILVGS